MVLFLTKLLVCTWRHGGHVGGQEQKHFSPLGTKLYFHVNSSRKNSIEIDPKHGRLVKWLQTENISLGVLNPLALLCGFLLYVTPVYFQDGRDAASLRDRNLGEITVLCEMKPYPVEFSCWPKAMRYNLNPLSPNIYMQNLETDLHTFPSRISWENLLKDHGSFSLEIILLILIILSLDNV